MKRMFSQRTVAFLQHGVVLPVLETRREDNGNSVFHTDGGAPVRDREGNPRKP